MFVFFLPNLQAGGAERVMLNLLIECSNNNPSSNLVLLLGEKKGQLLKEVPSSIDVFTLNSSRASRSVISFIKFCRKHKPIVVFSSLGSSLTTSLAKSFVSKDILFINRIGNTIGAEKLLFTNKIKRHLYILANKLIAKMSDHVIFQCHYMKEDYLRETKIDIKNYSVIYNPVLTDVIHLKANKKSLKKYNFVAVGRLSPQKDYPTLLAACKILKEKGVRFNLAILGEGDLRNRMEMSIKNFSLEKHVFLLGHVANPYPYFKEADYLVSSSLYEGFSNVIIEALCLGTPVLATNCPGGNAEVITSGKNVFLCDVANPEALANTLLKGKEYKESFKKEDIAKNAIEKFSVEVIFKQYLNIFKKHK